MSEITIGTAIGPVIAAIAYSLVTYSGKWLKQGETFLPKKFVRTVVIGLLTGLAVAAAGQELTLSNFQATAASFGVIHIADTLVNGLWGALRRYGVITRNDTSA